MINDSKEHYLNIKSHLHITIIMHYRKSIYVHDRITQPSLYTNLFCKGDGAKIDCLLI